MFERTWAGQQNRAAFLDVEMVCYVEGGEDPSSAAPDITFWSAVFETLYPAKSIRCVPKGGKPVLEALAKRVVDGEFENVIVAMDADYDAATGDLIIDPRVLYTWGYSWENDVFNDLTIQAIYSALTHRGKCSREVSDYLRAEVAAVVSKMKWCVKADHIALCRGTSVLPREAPGRVIAYRADDGRAIVRNSEALKLFRAARAEMKNRPVKGEILDFRRHLVGKYLQHLAGTVLRGVIEKFHRRVTVPSASLRDLGLQLFRQFLASGGRHPIRAHHVQQCAGLP